MKIVICHDDPVHVLRSALLFAFNLLPDVESRADLVDDLEGMIESRPLADQISNTTVVVTQKSPVPIPAPLLPTPIPAPLLPTPLPPAPMGLPEIGQVLAAAGAPVVPPAVTVAPNPQIVGTAVPERDSAGLPWDHRIHSRNKTMNQDGQWKRQKGVNDEAYNVIRAELMGTKVAVAPPGNVVVPPAPPVPVVPPAPPAAPAPPVPAPQPPAPPVADGGITWPVLLAAMTAKQNAGQLDPTRMADIAVRYGVASFALLASRPDTWATLYAEIGA